MTHKPTRGSEMVAFAFLCLQLSMAVIAKDTGHTAMKTVAEHEVTGEPFVAREMLDDQKFATLTVHYGELRRQFGIHVKVVGPNYDGRKCVLPRSMRPSIEHPINRVSRKIATLFIYALNERLLEVPLNLILVNTEDCTLRYAYDGTLPRVGNFISTSTNSSDQRFTMITHGERYCGKREWCRMHFDPIYRKREALDFDFSWEELESIEPATESFDANLFVARVALPKTNLTSVRLYDLSKNRTGSPYTELMTIPSQKSAWLFGTKFRPISSGLSFCSQVPRSNISSRDDLQCVRFRENGSVMFNQTIRSPGFELRVQTISNGIALFSTMHECLLSDWCKTVQVAMITRSSDSGKSVVQIRRREYNLTCHFETSTLRVKLNEATNTIKYLEYMCNDDLRVSSRIIYEL